jgi:hypothetical protein
LYDGGRLRGARPPSGISDWVWAFPSAFLR